VRGGTSAEQTHVYSQCTLKDARTIAECQATVVMRMRVQTSIEERTTRSMHSRVALTKSDSQRRNVSGC
jgi:hypothetical protein